jgi:hypothetical protein
MLKDKEGKPPKVPKNNGSEESSTLLDTLKELNASMRDMNERMDDLENKSLNVRADKLRLIEHLYNTSDKHLPELTIIPLNSVRAFASGMTLEALFDDDVMSGKVSLSTIYRNAIFRLNRSVHGVHLGRGVRLAEEQSAAESEQAQESEMGGGAD